MRNIIGHIALWSGVILAVWAREALGAHWAHAAEYQVLPGQELVTDGPYRWIRHPMYTAFLVIFLGTEIMLGSWLISLSIPLYVFMIWQTRKEERVLEESFGEQYRHYQRRTGMIFPRIGGIYPPGI